MSIFMAEQSTLGLPRARRIKQVVHGSLGMQQVDPVSLGPHWGVVADQFLSQVESWSCSQQASFGGAPKSEQLYACRLTIDDASVVAAATRKDAYVYQETTSQYRGIYDMAILSRF